MKGKLNKERFLSKLLWKIEGEKLVRLVPTLSASFGLRNSILKKFKKNFERGDQHHFQTDVEHRISLNWFVII